MHGDEVNIVNGFSIGKKVKFSKIDEIDATHYEYTTCESSKHYVLSSR